jgi:hypothetical protein
MKVEILDDEVFDGLNPSDIEKYLAHTNWREFKHAQSGISVWDFADDSGKKYRVWLPVDRNLGDFAIGVGRLIKTLATVEDRSQLQLLEDLETVANGDIVRVSSEDRLNKTSSSLLLHEGMLLIKQAQDLTSAAACAAVEKREVFPHRRPNVVIDYLKKVRIGQTERGSYTLKLISPITSPIYKQLSLPDMPPSEDTPFERQVIIHLLKGLDALQRVSQETLKRGRFYFEAFQEVVSEGVSANLCEAIALADDNERYRPIEVSVTWSYALTRPTGNFRDISFSTPVIPYIAEAAQQFREKNPEDIILRGYVTALRRRKIGDPNVVTVVGLVDEGPRSIRITLSEDAYSSALHAHENDYEISVNGRLVRQGNFLILETPTNFHIIQE